MVRGHDSEDSVGSAAAPIAEAVLDVLTESQILGFLGERSVAEAAEHSRGFVRALSGSSGRVIDIGAGGGLPGLVIAHDRPDLELVLVDRRSKRTDFLRRVVRRLGWNDRVAVQEADVEQVILREAGGFDSVVARGFGPPSETIRLASRLVRGGGRIVISEPPTGDRWEPELLEALGLIRLDDHTDSVSVFQPTDGSNASRET